MEGGEYIKSLLFNIFKCILESPYITCCTSPVVRLQVSNCCRNLFTFITWVKSYTKSINRPARMEGEQCTKILKNFLPIARLVPTVFLGGWGPPHLTNRWGEQVATCWTYSIYEYFWGKSLYPNTKDKCIPTSYPYPVIETEYSGTENIIMHKKVPWVKKNVYGKKTKPSYCCGGKKYRGRPLTRQSSSNIAKSVSVCNQMKISKIDISVKTKTNDVSIILYLYINFTQFQKGEMSTDDEGTNTVTGAKADVIGDSLLDMEEDEASATDDEPMNTAENIGPLEDGSQVQLQRAIEQVADGINSSDAQVARFGVTPDVEPEPANTCSKKPTWVSAMFGTDPRVATVGLTPNATPITANKPDPYAEFDPKFWKIPVKNKNPLDTFARLYVNKLGLKDTPEFDQIGEPDLFADRRALVLKLHWGKVAARNKGLGPSFKVDYVSTFDGEMCVACDPDSNGKHHPVGAENRVVVLGDAHFPPIFGANGECIGVIRIAGGSPEQLARALNDILKSRATKSVGQKRKADGTVRNPEILILWAVNTHIKRVGAGRTLNEISTAQGMIQTENSSQFDFSSAILLVPNGHDCLDGAAGVHDHSLNSKMTVSMQNHALELLSQAITATMGLNGKHCPIMVEGFNVALAHFASGESFDHDGIELYVEANHNVIGNGEAIYIPPNLKLKSIHPGVRSGAGMNLAMLPEAEFKYLSAVVTELKSTQRFKTFFTLPNDNNVLAGVCLGVPIGKHNKQDAGARIVVENLIAYAEKHAADLYRVGRSTTMFVKPDIKAFVGSGKLIVVGASQANTFAHQIETQRRQTLAENNWKVERVKVAGGKQIACQLYLENVFSSIPDHTDGTLVIWMMSNLMLIDKSGRYNVMVERHADLVAANKETKRAKFGNQVVRNNQTGKVWATRFNNPSGYKLSRPIHPVNARVRTNEEVERLLDDVIARVKKISKHRSSIILVGPQPRHPERCCGDVSHLPQDFSPSEFTRLCYMVSTFLVCALEQKNLYVLHPGEVFGWGREPATRNYVGPDGVHLDGGSEQRILDIISRRMKKFQHELSPEGAGSAVSGSNGDIPDEARLGAGQYRNPFLTTLNAIPDKSTPFVKPPVKIEA